MRHLRRLGGGSMRIRMVSLSRPVRRGFELAPTPWIANAQAVMSSVGGPPTLMTIQWLCGVEVLRTDRYRVDYPIVVPPRSLIVKPSSACLSAMSMSS